LVWPSTINQGEPNLLSLKSADVKPVKITTLDVDESKIKHHPSICDEKELE
jgi:hypothetical protein